MTTKQIIAGFRGMVEQPKAWRYTQGKGFDYVRVFRGPKKTAVGLAQQLIGQKYNVDYEEEGPLARVTASIGAQEGGGEEVPVDVWQVRVNQVEKTLYEHPKIVALGLDAVEALRTAIEDKSGANIEPDGDQAIAYAHLLRGVESFLVEQSVVVHTQIVSSRYARTIAQNNVGKILTAAQMETIEKAPTGVLTDVQETVPDDSPYGFTSMFGWLKHKPEMSQRANDQWEVVTNYSAGVWSMWLYTAV
jgi:hypothetical protein